MTDALILAGGRLSGAESSEGATSLMAKGFLEVGGRSLVSLVIDAIQASEVIDRILVLAPPEFETRLQGATASCGFLPVTDDVPIPEKIRRGITELRPHGPMLVAAGDLPLLTADAVRAFVGAADAADTLLAFPLVERMVLESSFPGTRRTWITLTEGEFTGGNLVWMDPGAALSHFDLIEDVFAARKAPMRLVRILGLRFLLRLLLRSLRIEDIEVRASALIGGRARILLVPHAEIGIDVDRPEDLADIARFVG